MIMATFVKNRLLKEMSPKIYLQEQPNVLENLLLCKFLNCQDTGKSIFWNYFAQNWLFHKDGTVFREKVTDFCKKIAIFSKFSCIVANACS